MNRRKFLQWIGLGGTVVAVPALAAIPEAPMSGAALMAKHFPGPTIGEVRAESALLRGELGQWEGMRMYTKVVSLEEARAMYPPRVSDLHWSEEELAVLRAQERPPLVINMIKPSFAG